MHLTPKQPIICLIGSKCESRSHSFFFLLFVRFCFRLPSVFARFTIYTLSVVYQLFPFCLPHSSKHSTTPCVCFAMMTCFGYWSKRNEMQIVWLLIFFFVLWRKNRHTAAIILMSEKNLKKTATAFFSILLSQSSALCTEFPHQIEM